MGKYEVTQGEYLQVMGTNPSHFGGELSYPVETVSWNEAVEYCTALTRQERSAGLLPDGVEYRLPTEAQWEYACGAGTTTPFHYGDALRSGMANFHGRFEYPPCDGEEAFCWNPSGIYLERTTSVGSYSPNAWGLYDMHGNVWEWCSDWWSANLPGGSVVDPTGSPDSGELRVLRGGSWDRNATSCRTAFRYGSYPESSNAGSGFRVVLVWAQ
jgi:formylglycine-generating enzyme required for sulfatase activity